jgi:3',5'-cyclic AMP phosphodiesterase CpdA
VYALDSNCAAGGGCRKGTPQYRWLKADLAAHPVACSMAVMHHPTFSSGRHSNNVATMPLVSLLYRAGVEIVVNGHDHIYERFAPARPWGRVDLARGIRQFIVGTGGAGLYPFRAARPPHSERRQNRVHGVLRLALGEDSYAWRFLPVRAGAFGDRGTGSCHDPAPSAAGVLPNADSSAP